MVNWSDPAVIQKCAAVFGNLIHITAGAYALDVLFTSVYDWEIIMGKRRRKWIMLVPSLRITSLLIETHFDPSALFLLQMDHALRHHCADSGLEHR